MENSVKTARPNSERVTRKRERNRAEDDGAFRDPVILRRGALGTIASSSSVRRELIHQRVTNVPSEYLMNEREDISFENHRWGSWLSVLQRQEYRWSFDGSEFSMFEWHFYWNPSSRSSLQKRISYLLNNSVPSHLPVLLFHYGRGTRIVVVIVIDFPANGTGSMKSISEGRCFGQSLRIRVNVN